MQLVDLYPRLATVPHLPLAERTDVQPLRVLSEDTRSSLWIKRDDQTGKIYGGNKVRKLGFLLGEARRDGAKTLLTGGAWGSHHVLATSLYGKEWGFDVEAVTLPQPMTPHVEENLRMTLGSGTKLHPSAGWTEAAALTMKREVELRIRRKKSYRIPYGGSSPVGAFGYVEAGLEFADQIAKRECPEPHAIYLPMGSSGTTAGLAVGLAAAGLTTPIVAIAVTPRLVANELTVQALITRVVHALRKIDPSFPAVAPAARGLVRVEHGLKTQGYGTEDAITREASVCATKDGIEVDPTYTARALAALLREARGPRRGENLLFWNTLSSVDLTTRLESAPGIPRWATNK